MLEKVFLERRVTIESVLSRLFPPKMGKLVYTEPTERDEQGWAGNVREKKYRDGIDRVMHEGI
jgi:hypothetical protein